MKNRKFILIMNLTLSFALIGCENFIYTSNSSQDSVESENNSNITSDSNICDIHMDDDNNDICDICQTILLTYDYSADGTYVLNQMSISNIPVEDTYYSNYITLLDGNAKWYKTTITGKKIDEATYLKEENKITITIGAVPYEFNYDEVNKTLSYDGTMNRKKVKIKLTKVDNFVEDNSKGTVSFDGELFGDDINQNFYNYCPSILIENNNTMHIWYCSNEKSGNVTDYVAYRKGTLYGDGKWTFSDKKLVLSPGSDGEWDARHVCDPSVVKGQFKYENTQYNYLMSYLGCYTSNVTCNEVGIAVAKNPEGPWVKVKNINPIANYYNSSMDFGSDGNKYWGYGQPSLINVDKKGTILLFYTKGVKSGTFTYAEKWDLSDMSNPIKLNERKLDDNGEIKVFNNADFAYDPVSKRIYTIKEDHGTGNQWYPNNGGVDWISGSNTVYYTSMNTSDEQPGDSLFKNHSWSKVATINKELTGFDRVHNSGIVTDEYGWIIDYSNIPVVYTMSKLKTDFPNWELGGQWPALHTYRLHGYNISM